MPAIGPLELLIILVIVLVIFGARRLPQIGRDLGGGMREFKNSVTGKDGGGEPTEDRPALEASTQDRDAETVDGEIVRDRS